jgi:putative tryptophan/tyrosine transport system substrate-binding protein
MRRREFITLVGSAAAAWSVTALAQQSAKVSRIGFLRFGSAADNADRVEALRAGLRQLGYFDGKNILIEFRWAETVDQLPELAAELVRMNVDIIFAMSSTEVEATRQLTMTTPIMFSVHADSVGLGHVASLARPGGNITGLTVILTDIVAKQLEILKEVVPQARRIGVLFSPTAPSHRPAVQAVETAGRLGVHLVRVPVRNVEEFEGAFSTMLREQVGGFLVVAAPLFVSHLARITELAIRHRLAGMFGGKEYVEAGGLMSYHTDLIDLCRRAANYIDRILKGAKPADVPVEQPTKFELAINNKTAKAIGLTIPESFLLAPTR